MRLLRAGLPARVVLKTRVAACLPPVLADATQIQQVLINLATNAMQAMQGQPGRIDIELDEVTIDATLLGARPELEAWHAKHPGPGVCIVVRDDGPGMDADTRGRIFEPFFTTKPVGEGTGLGLAVVHGIMQTHEGAITVQSEPGKGTAFALYLPVAPVAPDQRLHRSAGGPGCAARSTHRVRPGDDRLQHAGHVRAGCGARGARNTHRSAGGVVLGVRGRDAARSRRRGRRARDHLQGQRRERVLRRSAASGAERGVAGPFTAATICSGQGQGQTCIDYDTQSSCSENAHLQGPKPLDETADIGTLVDRAMLGAEHVDLQLANTMTCLMSSLTPAARARAELLDGAVFMAVNIVARAKRRIDANQIRSRHSENRFSCRYP